MDNNLTIEDVLSRGVVNILPSKEGLAHLMKEKKITLYQGFDPSMPSLHLGNLVGIMKLRQFQELGHKVYFLIGDFSGMIGDPTDKASTRRQLDREEVRKNCENWLSQISNILEFKGDNPAEVVYNSSWLDKTTFKDLINIASKYTIGQLIERDMFQDRIGRNEPIYLHEFLYPVATSIDCVELDVDLEIGGNDQMFNLLAGRTLMKSIKNKEKYVLTTKLLVDKEGNKVGKTTGNALFLDSKPEVFYSGILSFPDSIIQLGYELLTNIPLDNLNTEIKKEPMNLKKALAYDVVRSVWGKSSADYAQEYFEKTFQGKTLESNFEDKLVEKGSPVIELVSGLLGSKSKAKALITQGGVDLDGSTLNNINARFEHDSKIKIGKKLFFSVKIKL